MSTEHQTIAPEYRQKAATPEKQTRWFRGEHVTFRTNPRGLISNCSRWEWILDMEKEGIVRREGFGSVGYPPDFILEPETIQIQISARLRNGDKCGFVDDFFTAIIQHIESGDGMHTSFDVVKQIRHTHEGRTREVNFA